MRGLLGTLALAIAMAASLHSGSASAQGAATPPARIAGTVVSADERTLVVATTDQGQVSIVLPADIHVTALVNRKLDEIKAGDFVGSAAVMGADGKLHAQEVHIFPESMRGAGEGHRPMSQPKQSMTNATVAEAVAAPEGSVLRLKYAGGEQDIEVGSGVRVVGIVPGDRALLKPGAAVLVFAARAADGTLTARFLQAEKDGVKPLF